MHVRSLCAAVGIMLAAALPAWAHHSHGNYNMEAFTDLKGTVKEVHWMNPHTFIYLEVVDAKGEAAVWALESQSITQLLRKPGFEKDAVKVGDKVSVRCHQLRDGSNGCLLATMNANGKELVFD
jgi:Family of unknown function (DUF6152)